MKIIATAVAFLLFALTTKSCMFGVATAETAAVLDSDGDELRTGIPYYVVSTILDIGGTGGLDIGRRSTDKTCPGIVVQLESFFKIDFGTPVIFTNPKGDGYEDVVRLSTDLNIEFVPGIDLLCATSTVWKIDDEEYIHEGGNVWVIIDGIKGKPSPETLNSMFKIEKAGKHHYKFYYCPSLCDDCGAALCDDIDRQREGRQVRLALGDFGWPWEFRKANNTKMIKQVVNA